VTPGTGFAGTVSFSTSGLPSGASASFNPSTINSTGSTTLSVATIASIPTGSYAFSVTAISGTLVHSVDLTLVVSATSQGSIQYVQSNYADPQTPTTSLSVPYTFTQTAGDLNVVVVGWNDTTAQVSSVKDTAGNVYQLAVGPTKVAAAGGLNQSIYYAKNIAASGANTVTVTFDQTAGYPDIRILEYSGIDRVNPVDVIAAQTQTTGTICTSGNVATTNPADLLVAANTIQTFTAAPDATFTERVHSSPDGQIVEDRAVTAAGLYSAGAALNSPGAWVMQMVAFRAAGSPPPASASTQTTLTRNLARQQQLFQ